MKKILWYAVLFAQFPFVTLPARIFGFLLFFAIVGKNKGYKTAARFVKWANDC